MKPLELTEQELDTLQEVLETDIAQLRLQEAHTDTRDYRALLKHKEEILNKILQAVEQAEAGQRAGMATVGS